MKYLFYLMCLFLIIISSVTGSPQNNQSDGIREIQVGAVLPLDGQWASIGRDCELALNLSTDTLNSYLKPYNRKIILDVKNSGSDPQKALEALKTLHQKGVTTVVGPCTSAEAAAMVPYADENNIVLVSPSSTAVSLAKNDNLIRLAPNDTNQAGALALLMKKQNISQVLVVYVDDEYGSGLDTCLRERASDPTYGLKVIKSVPFDPSLTSFDPLVREITSASTGLPTDTGAIILIGSESHAVGIFTSAGLNSPLTEYKWYSGDGIIHQAGILENKTSAEFAAKTRLEGFAYACEETVTIVPTMMAAGLMSEVLKTAPSPDSLLAWDAIWYIAETYRLNPGDDPARFKSNLQSVIEQSGNVFNQVVALDDNGDIKAAKYARFKAVKDKNGEIYWNLEGMFINSILSGAFITDADGNLTRKSGDITIGVVLPMTGLEAETGRGAKDAIELAGQHANSYYNSTEGLHIRFSFDYRDSTGDPATALTQVKALHEAGVKIIIMGGKSAELAAVQDYCRTNNIIVLGTRSTAISLSDSDDLIYRLSPDDTKQAKALSRLMETQGRKHLVVLYRDDIYGRDLQKALSEMFPGSTDCYGYPVNETDFSSVLDNATAAIEKPGSHQDTAVVIIGLDELVRLLETVKDGPLTSVAWYGTDGIAQNRQLLTSPRAVSVSRKTNLTCSIYDVGGQRLFMPMHRVAVQYLSRSIGGTAGWNEISNYDAAWMAMNAYALTGPDAGYQDLWGIINNKYGTGGIGGVYVVNTSQDQTLSSFMFYSVAGPSGVPEWKPVAYYRDVMFARDDLGFITD